MQLAVQEGLAGKRVKCPGCGVVSTGTPGAASGRALTTADADAIVRTVPGVTLISRVVFGTAAVGVGNQGPPTDIQAVDATYALNPAVQVAHGAFFTAEDAIAANRVAVLGAQEASSLFAGAQSPIGQTIRIGALPFTVVGVLDGQSAPSDGSVLIPFQTGQVRLFGAAEEQIRAWTGAGDYVTGRQLVAAGLAELLEL